MTDLVLDTSAVLAAVLGEPGGPEVERLIRVQNAALGAVNLSEAVAKLSADGLGEGEIRSLLAALTLTYLDFDSEMAYEAGLLRPATRAYGLSLGDRACLALARKLGVSAVTADRVWERLQLGVDVVVIR